MNNHQRVDKTLMPKTAQPSGLAYLMIYDTYINRLDSEHGEDHVISWNYKGHNLDIDHEIGHQYHSGRWGGGGGGLIP